MTIVVVFMMEDCCYCFILTGGTVVIFKLALFGKKLRNKGGSISAVFEKLFVYCLIIDQ